MKVSHGALLALIAVLFLHHQGGVNGQHSVGHNNDENRRMLKGKKRNSKKAKGRSKGKKSKAESKKNKKLVESVLNAEVVSLNHLWSESSPILALNPPYGLTLSLTHEASVGIVPGLTVASDVIQFSGQHGAPTIDAIGHIGSGDDGTLFGGVKASSVETPDGLSDLGIDKYPEEKYVNRGILLDVARCKGMDALPNGYEVMTNDLKGCADQQGVKIRKGDSVLIRVGYGPFFESDTERYLNDYPGPSEDVARYLASKHIFLAGADNISFEKGGTNFPAHRILIAENGIHIVENLNLEKLAETCAERGVWEFVLVVNPPKIYGATAMALNAFALFPGYK